MVQIKEISGIILYPVITTINNKITVHFTDGLSTSYKIFVI
jgi:hypothetical protein